MLAPFLLALCWALALAIIAKPVYAWMTRKWCGQNLAAVLTVVVVAAVVIVPIGFLVGALSREAFDVANRLASDTNWRDLESAMERGRVLGPAFRWLDSEIDLPKAALDAAGAAARTVSQWASSLIAGSMRLLTQIGVTLFVLFYFLRDEESILSKLQPLVPLPAEIRDTVFLRISQTIRVSLGGKLVVSLIQGFLGGLLFLFLGLPAPVFWGLMMAVLSVFPIVGAFVVWAPVALMYAMAGDWWHALLVLGWGVLIIHPVDNLLGPLLVSTTLRLHTLLMFFSIIGGLAAFGGAGLVLGPMAMAVAVALGEAMHHEETGTAHSNPDSLLIKRENSLRKT
jgi:predicted PurR-regulated permease PerM